MALKVKGAKKIVAKELVPFTRQLSSMMGAGMTIIASIQTLKDQCDNPEFKEILTHLNDTLENGNPLSQGLADYPQVFDEMYVNMVVAGEQSGEFAKILKRLAVILQNSSRLHNKVKSAMTYPTTIVSIALLLAIGLIQFVVPVFAEMFSGFGKPLPKMTQALVDFSDFTKKWALIIIPTIVVLVHIFRKWKKTAHGRYKWDTFRLKMPVFGVLNQKAAIGRFCRLFAQMLSAGVPILRAMKVVSASLGNCVLEKSILDARLEVEQGNQLNTSLDGKPFMPVLMIRMLAAGEKAGKVDEMLDSVADSYDEEVELQLSTLTSLMEPFLMVFLGGIIGTIVTAMFLPIFSMGSLAGG